MPDNTPLFLTPLFVQQAQFMQACGQTVGELNVEQFGLYCSLMQEEIDEVNEAIKEGNLVKIFHELLDLHAATAGAGLSLGLPMTEGWAEVVRSNMTKVDPETGRVLKREDGKILKPATYSPPDLETVLKASGFNIPEEK